MNSELEGLHKVTVVPEFEILYLYFPVATEENHGIYHQNGLSTGKHLNVEPPEHEAGLLLTISGSIQRLALHVARNFILCYKPYETVHFEVV
jgi:hypothetical protein